AADVAQAGAEQALADACPDTDILVNNAGAIPTGDIFAVDEARWREAWDLKVYGYVNLMRAMYAHMKGKDPEMRPKVIVNVLGIGGGGPPGGAVVGAPPPLAAPGPTQ